MWRVANLTEFHAADMTGSALNPGEGMEVVETQIPEIKILIPRRFADPRGLFCETYSRKAMAAVGLHYEFVQDNQSLSTEQGVVRGLHFQIPPFAQDKLVRVTRGAVLDVAVDIRRNAPTFGKFVAVELSAENWKQMLIPAGFAHGFCTLQPNTEVQYKVTHCYSPQHDRGILWNDPTVNIPWPTSVKEALLSEKDRRLPLLHQAAELF